MNVKQSASALGYIGMAQSVDRNAWYTPDRYLSAVREVLGQIDLDPYSDAVANETVKAKMFLTKEENANESAWFDGENYLFPLKLLEELHLFIEGVSLVDFFNRNGVSFSKSCPCVCFDKINSNQNLVPLDSKEWVHQIKDKQSVFTVNIPSPSYSFIVDSGLFGTDRADTKRLFQELDYWLMDHFYLNVQSKIGSDVHPSFSDRHFSDAFMDTYAAFSVKKASTVGENFNGDLCVFHALIVPCIVGFIKHHWEKNEKKSVFCNPPYGRNVMDKSVYRIVSQQQTFGFQAIVLVNNATETRWFQMLLKAANAVCFTDRRIAFYSVDGKAVSGNTRGQAFFYFGNDFHRFYTAFCGFGFTVRLPGMSQ